LDAVQILELGRESIMLFLKITAPIMIVALVVGLMISLMQALTQIQEATLSFVPKIIAICACIIFMMPYMSNQLKLFTERLGEQIAEVGRSQE